MIVDEARYLAVRALIQEVWCAVHEKLFFESIPVERIHQCVAELVSGCGQNWCCFLRNLNEAQRLAEKYLFLLLTWHGVF